MTPPYNPHFEKLIMDKMEATSKSIENRFSELSIEFELRSKEMISVSQETKEEAQNLNQLLGNRTSRGAWGGKRCTRYIGTSWNDKRN